MAIDIVYQNVPQPRPFGLSAVEKQLRTMACYGSGFEARTRHIAVDGPIVLWRDYFDWTTFLAASAKGAGTAAVAGAKELVSGKDG
ncbi:hypothetical protein LCL61_19615 [Amycolatopsis coloradensis]|uniref:Uncharacterized protein n=1 Tax=Amycolatopsis coloradensis TaxID=76021 RepID=A0ACD5BEN7_9PSEU